MKDADEKTQRYQVTLSKGDYDRICRLAKNRGMSFSSYVRALLKSHLGQADIRSELACDTEVV